VASDGGPADFVIVWAAGRIALAGHAAAAYDWPVLKLVEERVVARSTAMQAGNIHRHFCLSPPLYRYCPM